MRNNLWNESFERYLTNTDIGCPGCGHTFRLQSTLKVLLSSLNRTFNKMVFIDHFHLAQIALFHVMNSTTQYSSSANVDNFSMTNATLTFESCWLGQLWPPAAMLGNKAFNNDVFTGYLLSLNIEFKPISPRHHNKKVLESKHAAIRSNFLRLTPNDSSKTELAALQAVHISKILYDLDILSAFETAKGFTKPVSTHSRLSSVYQDLTSAQI